MSTNIAYLAQVIPNFISILRFEGAQLKKAPGAVSKRGPILKKKLDLPFFGSSKI